MNLRKEVRKENLKRWKALGPAVIQKPLKHIAKLIGKDSHSYGWARHEADNGNGAGVITIYRNRAIGG